MSELLGIFVNLIIRSLPEGFMLILAILAMNKQKLDKEKYVESSLLLVLCTYAIRRLPIHYGVHILLNISVLIFLCVKINKTEFYTTIKSSLIITIVLMLLEGANVGLIMAAFGDVFYSIMENSIYKTLVGIPTITMFSVIVLTMYKIRVKNQQER